MQTLATCGDVWNWIISVGGAMFFGGVIGEAIGYIRGVRYSIRKIQER